jgi:hypothetical protein
MTLDEQSDVLMDGLKRLSTPAPRAAHGARGRARCHDRMRRRPRRIRIVDALLGGAAALYAVAVVAEGLRVLLR